MKYRPLPALIASAILLIATGPSGAQAQETAAFDTLYAAWLETPTGSEQEAEAATALRGFVERTLGTQALSHYGRYMAAPVGSQAESDAYDAFGEALPTGIRRERAEEMLLALMYVEGHAADVAAVAPPAQDELGPDEPLPELAVDFTLHVSQDELVAGDVTHVYGEVYNRSDQPVWILDTYTRLSLPRELWGLTTNRGALTAFFPTGPTRAIEVIRIDPDRRYTVHWPLDNYAQALRQQEQDRLRRHLESGESTPFEPKVTEAGLGQVVDRVSSSISEFLFFQPGSYPLAANVHIWTRKPLFTRAGVANPGDAFTLTTIRDVPVAVSLWVLIIGAILGGLAAFAFLYMLHVRQHRIEKVGGRRYVVTGIGIAVVVSVMGTVLAARLTGADFLFSISVNDFWGAIATGFLLQWVGLSYFVGKFESALDERDRGGDPAPGQKPGELPAEAPAVRRHGIRATVGKVPPEMRLEADRPGDPAHMVPAGDVEGQEDDE